MRCERPFPLVWWPIVDVCSPFRVQSMVFFDARNVPSEGWFLPYILLRRLLRHTCSVEVALDVDVIMMVEKSVAGGRIMKGTSETAGDVGSYPKCNDEHR